MKRFPAQFAAVRQLFRYRVYRRILLSFSALVIGLMLLVSLLLARVYSMYSASQLTAYSQVMMSQRVYGTDLLWEEMESLASAIYTDSDALAFLTQRKDDKIVKYHAGQVLAKYKALYSFIQNITLVNASAGQSASTLNYGDDLSFFQEHADESRVVWKARIISAPSFRYQDLPVLTMVYPLRSGACGIIIDIDQKHLQSLLQFNDVAPDASTVIIDGSGTVASATTEEAFLSSYADNGYFPSILQSEERQGSFLWKESGREQLITWQRLADKDWIVVSTMPASGLLSRFSGIIRLVIVGFLVVLAGGLAAAFLSSRRVYRPIRALVDRMIQDEPLDAPNEIEAVARKINLIQQDHAELKKTMHLTMVQHLLFGIPVNIAGRDTPLNGAKAYCVVTLKLSDLPEDAADSDQLIVAAGNIAAMMIQEACPCETAAWSTVAVLILCLPDVQQLSGEIQLILENACAWCREHFHCLAFASMSKTVTTPERIHDAYAEAQMISQYTFYDQSRSVLTASIISPWQSPAEIRKDYWVQRFAAVIPEGDSDAFLRTREEFFALLRQRPPRQARQAAADVLTELSVRLNAADHTDEDALLGAIPAAPEWNELVRLVSACLDRSLHTASELGQGLRNLHLVQEVCAYVQAHYPDPMLSLQSAADTVGLSASYLGRVFKAQMHQTFSEYVTVLRLEEAKRLLMETSKPISVIAHDVGLENQSYFSSLFRKAYGSSPSLFRQTNTPNK